MATGSGGHGTEDVLGALAAGRDLEGGGGHAHGPTADQSVRPAVPEDAELITDLQLTAWQARGLLQEEDVARVDTGAVRDQWYAAITDPPSRRHRVLTALARAEVVGFLAFAPAEAAELPESAGTEPVEVIALEVSAARTREGHGARLLAACADLAGEAGATSMSTWAATEDEARTRFLDSAGFAPAGQRRTLSPPGGDVVEHLWFALI